MDEQNGQGKCNSGDVFIKVVSEFLIRIICKIVLRRFYNFPIINTVYTKGIVKYSLTVKSLHNLRSGNKRQYTERSTICNEVCFTTRLEAHGTLYII